MILVGERKVVKICNTHYVSIPKFFADPQEKVLVLFDDKNNVIVIKKALPGDDNDGH